MIPRYFGYMFRQVRQRLLPAVRLPHWPLLLLRSPKKRFYGHFSRGMERIPHLAAFLGQDVVRLPRTGEQPLFWKYFEPHCTTLLAWGLKEATGKPAEQASGQSGLPLLRLEDGFLRSLDLGVRGAPPYALVLDDTGIYYDATRPSALENLLNNEGWQTPELLDEARAAMRAIAAHNLSKYNHAPDAPADLIPDRGRPRILVLDQTRNDLSVSLGLADTATFTRMLDAACREHPDADICVKTHPDVLSGRKQGFFQPQDLPAGVSHKGPGLHPF